MYTVKWGLLANVYNRVSHLWQKRGNWGIEWKTSPAKIRLNQLQWPHKVDLKPTRCLWMALKIWVYPRWQVAIELGDVVLP